MIDLKKIITAIGNSSLNEELRQNEKCNILCKDIETDEKLLEFLEKEDVDILFLSSQIICDYNVEELFKIILNMYPELQIVFFNVNKSNFENVKNKKIKVYEDIEISKFELEEILEYEEEKNQHDCKIISVFGARGIGKSTFSTFFAKNVDKSNAKILLVDFDLFESSIKTILKIKKIPKFTGQIKDLVITKEKNFDVLCDLNLYFNDKEKIDFFKVHQILGELKKEYDLIIIDTSSNFQNEYTKRIIYNSQDVIFLIEPNILGLKKAKNILEVLEYDWKIDNSKIKIVINKSNIYQISESIIEEIFPRLKIIGKIKYNDAYNLMINRSVDKKEIVKEYEKIGEKVGEKVVGSLFS